MAWMIKHHQLVMANKGGGTYGQLWIRGGGWSVQGATFLQTVSMARTPAPLLGR